MLAQPTFAVAEKMDYLEFHHVLMFRHDLNCSNIKNTIYASSIDENFERNIFDLFDEIEEIETYL